MRLESDRLIIKNAAVEEASFYFELFNDPDWITYINDKGLRSVEQTKTYLENTLPKNALLKGLGFFTVISKETNEPIGMTSALQRDKLDFIDVGYALLPKGRGKGYASEATLLMMEYIKHTFKQEKREWMSQFQFIKKMIREHMMFVYVVQNVLVNILIGLRN